MRTTGLTIVPGVDADVLRAAVLKRPAAHGGGGQRLRRGGERELEASGHQEGQREGARHEGHEPARDG
eukprot:CAMPEP_0197586608 /NCGR_PEP_ID=MMETSP1326-20131121/8528_1 /TAXON_ID=1155430 /ORGANISM="Genus nov. species nov., Strain RCC2288" /LENGTH=67 /DNA_ID=CAMNT_0043151251 /DNA_START=127 /DNA_END=330 /DNA_ORIENTATION=+